MGITINGSSAAGNIDLGTNGTITDLAEGGLPNGTVLPADLKSSSGTAGNTTYYRGDGAWGTISGGVSSDGDGNTVAGLDAGNAGTWSGAQNNTCIGKNAGTSITDGDTNTAVGKDALMTSSTASGNTAIGYEAMKSCTTQGYTTAVGYRALATMQTGATSNVAIGYKAMEDLTIADDGVAVGYGALQNVTEGVKNTACGAEALSSVTTGQKNTAFGYLAAYQANSSDNVAVGSTALSALTGGGKNVAVGNECLNSLATGVEATAIGYQAGNDYTASGGVFVGRQAGKTNATDQNTILYIARNADSAGNNGCWIYGNDIGQCFNGDNSSSWNTTSDERLKKDIVDNNVGLSVIDNVKVRNFKYKQYNKDEEGAVTTPKTSDDTIDLSGFKAGTTAGNVVIGQGKTGTQIGVIAQELEAVCPDCIKTDDFGAKTVNTDELFWHMLNAIKELSTKVKALEAG